jgi:hypothetical protein
LSSGKTDGPVRHSGLSSFPFLRSSCPTGDRHSRDDHLLRGSLHGQNPKKVLTILNGSAPVAEPMVHTTPPKEDKVDTSLAETPMAQTSLAQQGSKAPDDNLGDDDPELLNFTVVESEIICQMGSRLHRYWPDSGKPDYPVWYSKWFGFHAPIVGPAFLVFGHEDVEGGPWVTLWLAPLIILPFSILRTFWLDHPQRLLLSYDDLFALGQLGLRLLNQDLLPIELDHVHVRQEWVFIELHLATFSKFQLSFIYGRFYLSTENIAIVSRMIIRIMLFTISTLFELL